MKQTFDGQTATLRISRCKRMEHSGTYKCVIKNDSGMVETSANLTIKKVEEKKKKEEEKVEETVQVEEELEEEELEEEAEPEEEEVPAEGEPETKKGPFDVTLKKAKQNKTVIKVSTRFERQIVCFC